MRFSLILTALLISVSSYGMSYSEIKKLYQKSYTYEKNGDYKDAVKALMPIYESYPNGYTVNLRLGWLYYLMKNYANSEYHYRKALKALPSSIEAMLGLSLPLMAQSRWSDLESLMYRVIKIDYYNYYGNLRLCKALTEEKKYSIAESISRKMLVIYPTDVNFLNQLAISLYNQDKVSYAKSIFENVLTLDPENTTAKKYLKLIEPKDGKKKGH
jgi:tetratricopeptide (TPR) repeat protein